MGELVSVNVGVARQIGVSRRGRRVISAIGKSPVTGRVAVRGVNLAGDDQADRTVHGGPEKAVYAYASEDTAWWATVLGSELAPGAFGENLTTAGVDVSGAVLVPAEIPPPAAHGPGRPFDALKCTRWADGPAAGLTVGGCLSSVHRAPNTAAAACSSRPALPCSPQARRKPSRS